MAFCYVIIFSSTSWTITSAGTWQFCLMISLSDLFRRRNLPRIVAYPAAKWAKSRISRRDLYRKWTCSFLPIIKIRLLLCLKAIVSTFLQISSFSLLSKTYSKFLRLRTEIRFFALHCLFYQWIIQHWIKLNMIK